MICERCNKNLGATVYTEVVNGKAFARTVCAACLSALRESPSTGFEVAGSAPEPKRNQPSEVALSGLRAAKTCSSCGASVIEVLKSGIAGCPACYREFEQEMEPLLRSRHASLRHRGKSPRTNDARTQLQADLQSKRAMLRTALKMENYEEAAVLRDDIKTLETSLGAAGAGGSDG